ncbi:MAG: tail fiber protein [Actinomycetia bacterium]|nr:tail fiber protein [Actinomycetes bacterium]
MSEPFIAEIRIFGGNFAPRGWAFCNGQLLPIAQNTALFALIGTTYGGDGRTTTALPNLQGRSPMHAGRGPGLTDRRLGERDGAESVVLAESQIPSHSHQLVGTEEDVDGSSPVGNYLGVGNDLYSASDGSTLAGSSLPNTGSSQAHNNMQPYLTLNFIIALQGVFPSRN